MDYNKNNIFKNIKKKSKKYLIKGDITLKLDQTVVFGYRCVYKGSLFYQRLCCKLYIGFSRASNFKCH